MNLQAVRIETKGGAQDFIGQAAFTLPELLVSMAVFLFVMTAIISSHAFGLRMYELTKAKLGASDEARAAISKLTVEVRNGKVIRIGTGDLSSFAEVPVDSQQKGSAIQIYPT